MSTTDALVLTVHLFATATMVGLIWFVQIVHYPLFAAVGDDGFVAYEEAHRLRTGFVVGPLMGVEAATALWLVIDPPSGVSRILAVAGLVVLGVIQTSTVLLQVPAHARLSTAHDRAIIDRLVRTNWIRTVGWSVRGMLAIAMVIAVL